MGANDVYDENGVLIERAVSTVVAGEPEEGQAVTGRPNDIPLDDPAPAPLGGNSSFSDRAKANKPKAKQVGAEQVEDKAVKSAKTKKG